MTRALSLVLVTGLSLVAACRTTEPCPPGAAGRCATSTGPGEQVVTPGMENEFFTADNRQVIRPRPDVVIEPVRDPDGRVTALVMSKVDDGIRVECQCPSGCGSDGPLGCASLLPDPGEPIGDVPCTGDCVSGDSCCAGCGWVVISS